MVVLTFLACWLLLRVKNVWTRQRLSDVFADFYFAGAAGEKLSVPRICYSGIQSDHLIQHRGTGNEMILYGSNRVYQFRMLTKIRICTGAHGDLDVWVCSGHPRLTSASVPDLDLIRPIFFRKSMDFALIVIQNSSGQSLKLFLTNLCRAVARKSTEPNYLAFLKDGHSDRYGLVCHWYGWNMVGRSIMTAAAYNT